MNVAALIKIYLLTFFTLLTCDLIWLGIVAKNLYSKHLGFLMAPHFNFTAALLFYLIYPIGLMIFVILPSLESQSVVKPIALGLFFGFMCYATYNFTNMATVKNWPTIISMIDLFWGTFVTGLVALIGYLAARQFFS